MDALHRRRAAIAAICLVLMTGACSSTNRADTVSDTQAGDGAASTAPLSAEPGASPSAPGEEGTASREPGTGSPTVTGAHPPLGGGPAPAAPGVKRVTGPIEIGFVRTYVSNAQQFGFTLGETISEESVLDALVKAYNDKGGIAGRKIVPVYADTDTASPRWDADFAAACATFTQDHHVAAVLGYVFDFQAALEDCLLKNKVPHLSTTFNVPDAELVKRYTNLFSLTTPRIERRTVAKIDGAMRNGVLTRTSRLGILRDECAWTTRSWTKTVLPYIKRKALNLVANESILCGGGASDNSAAIQQLQNAILRFRSQRVDRVLFHSVSEGPALLLFSHEANSQGYSPTYIMSSLVNASVIAGQMPPNQAAKVHGYGWLPAQDVPPSKWPPVSSSGKRCIDMVRKQGLNPASPTDYSYVLNTVRGALPV